MNIRISDTVLKDTADAVQHMLTDVSREYKLSGIDGNMTVIIGSKEPKGTIKEFRFNELELGNHEIPEAFCDDKVYLVAESLL